MKLHIQYYFFYRFSRFVLECLGPDLPRTYLIEKLYPTQAGQLGRKYGVKMILNDYPKFQYKIGQMSLPRIEDVQIPVPGTKRNLQARFYYPPELRKDEFIQFPLVLHV